MGWLGERELWLIKRKNPRRHMRMGQESTAICDFFPVLIPRKPWKGAALHAHVLKHITCSLQDRNHGALLWVNRLLNDHLDAKGGDVVLPMASSTEDNGAFELRTLVAALAFVREA